MPYIVGIALGVGVYFAIEFFSIKWVFPVVVAILVTSFLQLGDKVALLHRKITDHEVTPHPTEWPEDDRLL